MAKDYEELKQDHDSVVKANITYKKNNSDLNATLNRLQAQERSRKKDKERNHKK